VATDAQQLLQNTLARNKQITSAPDIDIKGQGPKPLTVEDPQKRKRRTDEMQSSERLTSILQDNGINADVDFNDVNSVAALNSSILNAYNENGNISVPSFGTTPMTSNFSQNVNTASDNTLLQEMQQKLASGPQGGGATSVGQGDQSDSDDSIDFGTNNLAGTDASALASQIGSITISSLLSGQDAAQTVGINLASRAGGPLTQGYNLGVASRNMSEIVPNLSFDTPVSSLYSISTIQNAAALGMSVKNYVSQFNDIGQFASSVKNSFENTMDTLGKVLSDPIGAFSGAMIDFGNFVEYGTANPEAYDVEVGYGNRVGYTRDALTGEATTPGVGSIIAGMTPVVSTAYGLTQKGLKGSGYFEDLAAENQRQVEAALSGIVDFGTTTDHDFGITTSMTGFGNYASVSANIPGFGDFMGVVDMTKDIETQLANTFGIDISHIDPDYDFSGDLKAIAMQVNNTYSSDAVSNAQNQVQNEMYDTFGQELGDTLYDLGMVEEPSNVTPENIGIHAASLHSNMSNVVSLQQSANNIRSQAARIAGSSKETTSSIGVDTAGNPDPFATGSGYLSSEAEIDEPTGPAEAYDPNLTGPGYTTGFDPDTGEGDNVGGPGGPGDSVDTSAQTGVAGTDMSSSEFEMDGDSSGGSGGSGGSGDTGETEDVDIGDDIGEDVGDE
jgi:hypothetical protein